MKKLKSKILSSAVIGVVLCSSFTLPAFGAYVPGIPAAVDPGTPNYSGAAQPVPTEPVAYDPSKNMLGEIYKSDKAAGGESYWIDRILERPGSAGGNDLFTRGRALYMYTHTPSALGFGGGYAYREMPTGSAQNLYTVTLSDSTLSEVTTERKQYPSYWSSAHQAAGISVKQKKFITFNNVAVTVLEITNTGDKSVTKTLNVSSPIASTPSKNGTELTGSQKARYDLTTMYPRLSGDGMTVDGTKLTKSITLDPGKSTTVKVQMGVTTKEIPESTTDYERFAAYDAKTAFQTQLDEYNKWWSENVPYIDIPDQNIKKMSYYRTFLNRFNYLDANIPGNDFQFPVSLEGVLGYNNAIQLTQPMHMQDLKYFRNPIYSYGNWVSSGESSKYSAFQDNPGDPAHWNNTYEQWIADEAWEAYKVHGGDTKILNNLARYAEGDVKGQLDKFDTNKNYLVQYDWGSLTGNDADAVALNWRNRDQERTDQSAFNYSSALAAAEAYKIIGNDQKAKEMSDLAENIKKAILTTLWDDSEGENGKVFKQKDIQSGELVPWKDQQNFSPFTQEVVPNTDNYKKALRFYADKNQFPIMPFFTANQADKKLAVAAGRGGSNNFSNINSTLQARLFATAIRKYPSEYITPDMYRKLIEWLTWTQYVNGDNRYPDNNEFWNSFDDKTKTLNYRSWIHHNILGAYNFSLIEDIAGMQPRTDETLELWPIDMGYDYFTVNNLSYHGSDLTIVWDKPDGKKHYENAPEGYSVYLDGELAFTVNDLVHLTYDSKSGTVTIQDDSSKAAVTYNKVKQMKKVTDVSLSDNVRAVDMFQKAGVDISSNTGKAENLAKGKKASASYTSVGSKPEDVTKVENAVDGFTVSGLPTTRGTHYAAPNPIWGTKGSPNKQDWYEVDFGKATAFDNVKLYFYSDKSRNNYREPQYYTIQYLEGTEWKNVPYQKKSTLQANFNEVKFNTITAQKIRVLMTPYPGFAVGLKEIQAFETGIKVPIEPNKAPEVEILLDDSYNQVMKKRLVASVSDDGQPLDFPDLTWSKKSGPGSVVFSDPKSISTVASFTEEGTYVVTLTANDGELSTSADIKIDVKMEKVNLALSAKPSTSYVSSWEDLNAINNGIDPKSSTDKTGGAYGNWNHNSPTEWVQYTWNNEVVINESDVYWWTDNGGILMPKAYTLQYLDADGKTWKDIELISGLVVEPNKYNKTTFKPVKTKALRMTITRGAQWTGILEWKVSEPPVLQINPDNVKVRVQKGEQPNLPKTAQKVFDGITQNVNITWDSISDEQLNAGDAQIQVLGTLANSWQVIPATVYVRSEANVTINTITEENVSTMVGVKPVLPSVVEVQYNDGSMDNMNTKVTWDSIDPSKYSDAGEFTVYGTVQGTDIKAVANVTVKPTKDYFYQLIERAKAISNEYLIYTKKSYTALQDAIKAAEQVGSIETDTQLNEAVAPLKSAVDGLVNIPINYDNLAALTNTFVLEYGAPGSQGISNSLVKKLENAKKASSKGNINDANELTQSYIDEVSTYIGKKLSNEQGKVLIWWARKLLIE
ncbi:Ig-like domain-containing protein [Neobacillus sp. NPDC058068]|uniref:Ig-like domain-containing protein n=1 Tax=Neobacillus sp. NPDC058068 TaxID=3346325 RepID=UPI0036D9F318